MNFYRLHKIVICSKVYRCGTDVENMFDILLPINVRDVQLSGFGVSLGVRTICPNVEQLRLDDDTEHVHTSKAPFQLQIGSKCVWPAP